MRIQKLYQNSFQFVVSLISLLFCFASPLYLYSAPLNLQDVSITGFWGDENYGIGFQEDGTFIITDPSSVQHGTYIVDGKFGRLNIEGEATQHVFEIVHLDANLLVINDFFQQAVFILPRFSVDLKPIVVSKDAIVGDWQIPGMSNIIYSFNADGTYEIDDSFSVFVDNYSIDDGKIHTSGRVYQAVYFDSQLMVFYDETHTGGSLTLMRFDKNANQIDSNLIVGIWENVSFGNYLNEFASDGTATLSSFSNVGMFGTYTIENNTINLLTENLGLRSMTIERLDDNILIVNDISGGGRAILLRFKGNDTENSVATLVGTWGVGSSSQFGSELTFNEDGTYHFIESPSENYTLIDNVLAMNTTMGTKIYEILRLDNQFLVLDENKNVDFTDPNSQELKVIIVFSRINQ